MFCHLPMFWSFQSPVSLTLGHLLEYVFVFVRFEAAGKSEATSMCVSYRLCIQPCRRQAHSSHSQRKDSMGPRSCNSPAPSHTTCLGIVINIHPPQSNKSCTKCCISSTFKFVSISLSLSLSLPVCLCSFVGLLVIESHHELLSQSEYLQR